MNVAIHDTDTIHTVALRQVCAERDALRAALDTGRQELESAEETICFLRMMLGQIATAQILPADHPITRAALAQVRS